MKNWTFGLIIAVLLVVGGFFVLSEPNNDSGTTAKSANTTPTSFDQIQSAVGHGAQLLDVRTADEYTAGHISGASNFSLQDMQAGNLPTGSKQQTIYIYCHSGNRAGQATTILKNAGYGSVINLGAIAHVQAIGGKLVTGSEKGNI